MPLNFNFHGKETLVEYTYPWLPSRCSNCNKWGHLAKGCLSEKKKSMDVEEAGEMEKAASEDSVVDKGSQTEEHTGLQESVDTVTVTPIEDTNMVVVEGEKMVAEIVETETHQENEQGWSTPKKACRSPDKTKVLEYGHVSILTNSRFSVLSAMEVEGEIIEKREKDGVSSEQSKKDEVHIELNEQTGGLEVQRIAQVSTTVEQGNISAQTEQKQQEENDIEATNADVAEGHLSVQNSEREVVKTRQSLPRISKANHRYLSESTVQKTKEDIPSVLNKKNSRKNL